ncbi:hypothetical protein LIER_08433 [Lithospermum erythrorhizon]|uniref:Signal peptidase complex subunit 1 n=1 Tax=Lithospermum erythrorhizon TaxID=34254 RepID=A0AAV3PC38_LITER
MANDAAFRSSLLWLALIILITGLCTHSFKKMLGTYFFGMFAIGGVLLPDWEFLNRNMSQWCTPVTLEDMNSAPTQPR